MNATFTRSSWKNKWVIILYLVIASTALFYGSIGLLGLGGPQNVEVDFSNFKDPRLTRVFERYSKFQPDAQELAYLSTLVQSSRRPILCQLGFNPFIAYYQLMLNPNSVVYSFHRAQDEQDEELIYDMAASFPHLVPILGNSMHSIRAFVREFGANGAGVNRKSSMWEEYSEFSYSGEARYKIRDLFIDEKTGVRCDIVYRSDGGNISALNLMALLSRHNTQVIYKGDSDGKTLKDMIRVKNQICLTGHQCIYHGQYKNVELGDTTAVNTAIQAHHESLKKVLSVASESSTAVWIPVGSAHQFFADALYCSLTQFNVSNYVFFAHDAEIHQYLLDKGRNSFYDDLWYTTMHGKQGYHSFTFNIVMRERFSVILDVLELGYNILMNDADTLWMNDLLPGMEETESDLVAQMDQPTDKYFEVCTGFVFYKNKPRVRELLHKFQQMSFYFPRLDDQELSNLMFKSKQTCLIWHNKNIDSCSRGHSISVQLKNPVSFVSGHLYCLRHDEWSAKHVKPSLIHLNGAPNKDHCVEQSKQWGYPFVTQC